MKYMGSKARIAKDILPFIQEHLNGDNYFVDAFCGGCNLIDKLDYPKRIANDKNEYLIAMWCDLQQGRQFPMMIDKEIYSIARNVYNGLFEKTYLYSGYIGWIGWMGSYNGRFFDGGYSGHNVKGRDYIGEQIRNTLRQINCLGGVLFFNYDYKELPIPKNSVIYCDIPYKNTKQYAVSKDFNHEKFWQWCRDMTNKGHKVFISEYNAPDDFTCIWQKEVTNAMNTTKTYKPIEKLFTI